MQEQCELGEVQMSIRIRGYPIHSVRHATFINFWPLPFARVFLIYNALLDTRSKKTLPRKSVTYFMNAPKKRAFWNEGSIDHGSAVEWGRRLEAPSGSSLLEALVKLNIYITNEVSNSMYVSQGRSRLYHRCHFLQLCVDEGNKLKTHSEHQTIRYQVGGKTRLESSGTHMNERKRKTTNLSMSNEHWWP